MPSRKRSKNDSRALCAHLYPDDGVNPREDKRRDAKTIEPTQRKLRQLCKQAAHALHLALGGLPEADVLAGTTVREVTPAPNAGRLRAILVVPSATRRDDVEAVVQRHIGRLRTEVAVTITRRRAPELVFTVLVEEARDD